MAWACAISSTLRGAPGCCRRARRRRGRRSRPSRSRACGDFHASGGERRATPAELGNPNSCDTVPLSSRPIDRIYDMSRPRPLLLAARLRAPCLGAERSRCRVRHVKGHSDDHALQRPARTDDGDARAAFEKQTGIKVECAPATRPNSPTRSSRRARAPPPTCSTPRTPPRSKSLASKACWLPSTPSTLAAVPARYSSAQATGWASRRACRCSSTTLGDQGRAAAELDPRTGPAEVEGQGRLRAIGDRLPAARDLDLKLDGTAAAENWLKGLKANSKVYPDNETVVAQVNNGESAVGPINHYYWYRLRDEIGAERDALGAALLRRRTTLATSSTSPARRC